MALSDRVARGVLLGLGGLLAAAVLRFDLATATNGTFWSDGATYHAMAWSLAEDRDLRFEPRDVFRVRREFPGGPQGIFLKRTEGGLRWDPSPGAPFVRWGGGERNDRIFFAKAFAYPLAAAPFVKLFGTSGLLLLNVSALVGALWLAYGEVRTRASPLSSLCLVLALFGITVTPVYLLWLTPEMFNLGLIAGGLCLTPRRPLLAALMFGVVTYSKPYNLFVALPLGVAPFLPWLQREAGSGFLRALVESLRRGAILGGTTALLFVLNLAFTGELNYQGGERKTFYGLFPFEARPDGTKVTFGNSGIWMTTDHLGPLVEGRDEEKETRRTGPLRPPEEMRASFWRNLGYFWIGRFGGALGYFLPALVAIALFLLVGPRTERGWLGIAALTVSWIFYIWMIPDNWYGGGGTVGNRYFLNLLPLAVLVVPRGREWPVVAAGVLGAGAFLASVLSSPLRHSLHPGDHAKTGAFRRLPPELTMLNDLSVFTEPWRKKQPFGNLGDPTKKLPADPTAYTLYFMDDGSWGKEVHAGREGFWVRAGSEAEVIVRVLDLKPVERIVLEVSAGPGVDGRLRCRLDGEARDVPLQSEGATIAFSPSRGFPYYETFLHVLRCQAPGDPKGDSDRPLGAFVSIRLEVR
jgi:hypothetical protein